MDDEAPDYRNVVHNPMDVATLLQRVDSGQYLTKRAFLADVDLIPANAQVCGCRPVVVCCFVRNVALEVLDIVGWWLSMGTFLRSMVCMKCRWWDVGIGIADLKA